MAKEPQSFFDGMKVRMTDGRVGVINRGRAWVPNIDFSKLPPDVAAEIRRANEEAMRMWMEGIKAYQSEFARLGGLASKGISTPNKRRASRANGRLGGRPRGSKTKTMPTIPTQD